MTTEGRYYGLALEDPVSLEFLEFIKPFGWMDVALGTSFPLVKPVDSPDDKWTYSSRLCFLKKLAQFFPWRLCEDHGYTYHWIRGGKPHLIKNGKNIDCNISHYVPFVVPVYRRVLLHHPHLLLQLWMCLFHRLWKYCRGI